METSIQILSWTLTVVSIFAAIGLGVLTVVVVMDVIDEIKSRRR